MKVNYKSKNGRFNVEFDSSTQVELFQGISRFQEVFEQDTCGKCGSTDLKFVVRNVDDDLYYELRCNDCGAKLALGVMKKGGGLFPKRKDADGNWLPDNGWVKWNPQTKQEE